MSRNRSRKMPRVVVRPINKKHGNLPATVAGCRVLLIRCNERRKVEATQLFMPEATSIISAPGFTHYAVLPFYV